MKSINSHIQIPKFILKQFEKVNNELYYYDFSESIDFEYSSRARIKKGYAKTLNTEKDYYSEETEKYLSKEVEEPLSRFLYKVYDVIDGKAVTINNNDVQTVIKYFSSLLARGRELQSEVENNPYWASVSTETALHGLCAYYGTEKFSELKLIENPCVSIGINYTDIPLVLPNIGFCKAKNTIIAPVTPKLALMIAAPEGKELFLRKDGLYIARFETNETVTNLNLRLFINEKEMNGMYVTATSKRQLLEMVEELDKSGDLPGKERDITATEILGDENNN